MRIATWNLHGNGGRAREMGALLSELGGADLVLMQEAPQSALPTFCEAAGLDWHEHVRDRYFDLLDVSSRTGARAEDGRRHGVPRCVAIGGRRVTTGHFRSIAFPQVPLPEKVLGGWIDVEGQRVTVLTYHAPTGAQHGPGKARQALAVATWLQRINGPVIMGGDFNTPGEDAADPAKVRTGWHTGHPELHGEPGEDVLVGGEPMHRLSDSFRVWLQDRPNELQRIESQHPDGPLAVTYKTRNGREVRYDSIWLTPDFIVRDVSHHFEASCSAGSDHALVIVEADLTERSGSAD